jgi:hypothetical protein
MLSQETFKTGLTELMTAFNMELTPEQSKVWYKHCKCLKDVDFTKKVVDCIMFCRHKPYIADLLNLKEKDNFQPANAGAYEVV